MFPVFSLVLDQDVKPEMALLYPELYKDLTKVGMSSVLRYEQMLKLPVYKTGNSYNHFLKVFHARQMHN